MIISFFKTIKSCYLIMGKTNSKPDTKSPSLKVKGPRLIEEEELNQNKIREKVKIVLIGAP